MAMLQRNAFHDMRSASTTQTRILIELGCRVGGRAKGKRQAKAARPRHKLGRQRGGGSAKRCLSRVVEKQALPGQGAKKKKKTSCLGAPRELAIIRAQKKIGERKV